VNETYFVNLGTPNAESNLCIVEFDATNVSNQIENERMRECV
jgi:hypothetical protein